MEKIDIRRGLARIYQGAMLRSMLAATSGAAIAMGIALAQAPAPKIILLVGPPGSGKTTQSKFLAKKYGLSEFSMADLLKKEMAQKKDSTSKTLAAAIASGDMLPDDAATNLIKLHLMHVDLSKGFILDGYPATAGQAKSLDQMLENQRLPKPVVVVLEAPDDVIRKRMLTRRQANDKPEMVEQRIQQFRKEASLLTEWAGQSRVVRVNADASVANVSRQIAAGLENTWSKQGAGQRP